MDLMVVLRLAQEAVPLIVEEDVLEDALAEVVMLDVMVGAIIIVLLVVVVLGVVEEHVLDVLDVQDAPDVLILAKTAAKVDVIQHVLHVQELVLLDVVDVVKEVVIRHVPMDVIQLVPHALELVRGLVAQPVEQRAQEFAVHLARHNVQQIAQHHAEIIVAEQLHNKDKKEKYIIWLK